ncbi:MAG TPA: transglycosylase SLT domain-containing protein [Pyrinomonadaceae bacterium]|nr:transglycosylase SLT domain-containing protein [Pyrinomonadaceae bacterium]
MAGAEKVGNQPLVPVGPSRAEEAARRRRGGGAGFGERLSNDSALVRSERERTAPPLSDEAYLRERTFEELKTLVQAIQEGVTDPWQLTDLIFYARHPDMKGVPLTHEHQALLDEWNQISALLVHPTLNEVSDFLGANVLGGEVSGPRQFATAFERATHTEAGSARLAGGGVHRFDDVIARAVQWCPGLSPSILKGLLAQESNFDTDVINRWGYAGIAQFGREAAREVGLRVGVAGSATDERLDPDKAIPGAARLLHLKAQRLGASAFSRYGQPDGVEFWKFVLAAYNGGEGTVTLAMGHAYREGMARARAKGLVGPEAVAFARGYASKWENLKAGGMSSPLGLAAARYFPALAEMKYHEIGNYPTAIVARVKGAKG